MTAKTKVDYLFPSPHKATLQETLDEVGKIFFSPPPPHPLQLSPQEIKQPGQGEACTSVIQNSRRKEGASREASRATKTVRKYILQQR